MDFISGPQDDGSADELCRIDRRDFSHRRLTTCTWCRGYIWHDSPRGDIFMYLYIYIYLFVFCFKIFMTPTLSMRNVPQNVQSPGFWQRWYYKKLYKKKLWCCRRIRHSADWLLGEKRVFICIVCWLCLISETNYFSKFQYYVISHDRLICLLILYFNVIGDNSIYQHQFIINKLRVLSHVSGLNLLSASLHQSC